MVRAVKGLIINGLDGHEVEPFFLSTACIPILILRVGFRLNE